MERRPAGPVTESVWDYPRRPRAERVRRRARLVHRGMLVADTDDLVRVLETGHPPVYYLPRAEFRVPLLTSPTVGFCRWKGEARYVELAVPGGEPLTDAGWWYPEPDLRYPQLWDRVAVHPGRFDEVMLDGERVRAQPGDPCGGWITADVTGPFEQAPDEER